MSFNYFGIHNHTEMSNLRLLDSIIKPAALVQRARELGFKGICITDHEALCNHIEVNQISQQVLTEDPEFKIGLGNEIYLCGDRSSGQKYYHFILLAKNKNGHKALRELSSRAWLNVYTDRAMERVVTTYDDLKEIVNKYPNSLIGTSACLGGELSTAVKNLCGAERMGDTQTAENEHTHIVNFIFFCKELFGDDFYIECAPAASSEQITVNKRLFSIATCFNIKMVVGADAHYLRKEDRYVHSAYLNSKGGDRETDLFYEYAYLQDEEDMRKNLLHSFSNDFISRMFENSMEIYNKIENYSLLHSQQIPKVEVKEYPKKDVPSLNKYPNLQRMFNSEDKVERYWVNQCFEELNKRQLNKTEYYEELEEEADVKRIIGEKLDTNMFSYPVVLQHYIDLIWACGSTLGAGRGSACAALNHFLLGITQLDPLEWNFPFYRYMNRDTDGLGDIDIDVCPSKRPLILAKIKEERAQNFRNDLDELSKKNLGCTMIATFTTEKTKMAILTACRGYRSEEYPDGVDVDEAQYLASLVPIDRGFTWTLNEMLYGDEEKGRKPIKTFINEVNQYPGLLDIISGIEGLIRGRSSHASGVIMFDEDPYEHACFMKTKEGEVVTQYDLHYAEAAGNTKFDILVTAIQDKITQTLKFLQDEDIIEKDLSLKELYNKYLHPNILPLNDKKTWEVIQSATSLDLFQLDSEIGRQGAKKVKPETMQELSAVNGLIRLMASEKGAETPMEKYIRFRKNIKLWEDEMTKYGLTEDNKDAIRPYLAETCGVGISQECLMRVLMDPNICGFSLKEANTARKIVSKKKMNKINELHAIIEDKAVSLPFGRYVWDAVVVPQLGYSFSDIHSMSYSFVGFQTAYLATHWNPIYWNTSCLVVNSGSLEEDSEFEEDEDGEVVKKSEKNTDYGKIAKAINAILAEKIKVSLVDINRSDYSFKPDAENNQILFGMKALSGVNGGIIEQIVNNRPYSSIKDFMKRCPLNKIAMISLIKAGAFDEIEKNNAKALDMPARKYAMIYYIMNNCEAKTKLNLQNFNGLLQKGLVPNSLDFQKRVYNFNKYLKANKVNKYYRLDEPAYAFLTANFDIADQLEVIKGYPYILQTKWDKLYSAEMDSARDWLKSNQKEVLDSFNQILFKEVWDKYATGSLSKWEMDALCFYHSEHELSKINFNTYGIVDFTRLSSNPDVDYYFKKKGKDLPVYKIYRIAGTVIGKNDSRASISLLTPTGVVNVKFTKEYYAMFKKQISQRQEDGPKKVIEKSWFTKGTKLLIQGFRREDTFVAKTYSRTPGHQLYKITLINNDTDIQLTHERAGGEDEE